MKRKTLPLTLSALLLLSCGNAQVVLAINQASFDAIAPISLSVEAADKLKESRLSPKEITSAAISVRSSIYDQDGKGIIIEESFSHKKSGAKIASSMTLAAKTSTGKSKSLSCSLLYDAEVEGLNITVDSQSYYLKVPKLSTLFCPDTFRGISVSLVIPSGQNTYEDGYGSVKAGYGKDNNLVCDYRTNSEYHSYGGEDKTIIATTKTSYSDYYAYEEDGEDVLLAQRAVYDSRMINGPEGSFCSQLLSAFTYGYGEEGIVGSIDSSLPRFDSPYCYSPLEAFSFMPMLDLSNFFSDGMAFIVIAPYSPVKMSFTDIGSANLEICGLNDDKLGAGPSFWPRLSALQ